MSTTTLSASTAAGTRAPAPRLMRLAAPILMPLAPALTLVSGFCLSLDPGTLSEAELTAAVYADPGRQGLFVWSGFLEALLFPIAVIWAGRRHRWTVPGGPVPPGCGDSRSTTSSAAGPSCCGTPSRKPG